MLRGVDVSAVSQLLQQQRGNPRVAQPVENAAKATPAGAPEPGKGSRIDVVA